MPVDLRALHRIHDPLLVALGQDHPIGLDVIGAAIVHREDLVELVTEEIRVLKVARARLLNEQPA